MYLHWTDLIEEEDIPRFFNLYGQIYREERLFAAEDANERVYENELNAVRRLLQEDDGEQVFHNALERWSQCQIPQSDMDMARRALTQAQADPELPPDYQPPWAGDNFDIMSD